MTRLVSRADAVRRFAAMERNFQKTLLTRRQQATRGR
jgi:hypothetical protein